MDHVVYLDAKAKELDNLLAGIKTMIIRGATGRKMPYGRVNAGDTLYFLNDDAEGMIRARAEVKNVFHSEAMTKDESAKLIGENQIKLRLTDKQLARWSGKRYLVLIEVEGIEEITPFEIDKNEYGNMDDWLPVGDVNRIKR